jgi:2-polyprenyl-3-methyl-5-hydroxy-6-metoxy-1,4-benzoquinol methylase
MRLRRCGAEVVGVDYSEEPIRIAREKNPDCSFHVMDFRELDASIGEFDGIAAIASLIHVGDDELGPVFVNMKKVLKPGGYVMAVIIEGDGVSPQLSRIEKNGVLYDRTFWLHRKARLDRAAESAGFRYHHEIPLPDELAVYGWKCFVYRG